MAITKASNSTINTFTKYNDTAAGNVISGPAQFVIMSDSSACVTSSDGFTWTQRTVSGHGGDPAYFGKRGGYYTSIQIATSTSSFTSPDGITWTQNFPYPVGGNSVRTMYQRAIFEPNVGWNWNDPNTPSNFWVYPDGVRQTNIGIANTYGRGSVQNGDVIVIAAERYTTTGQPTLLYSTNGGASWASNNMGGSEAQGCRRPEYANGIFVVSGGSSGVWTSTNGSTWTSRNGSVTGRHVWYQGGLFFCGAISGGGLFTSVDGITWTARTSNLSNAIRGVVFGNGLYVAYAAGGQIATSTDAVTWTARTSNTTQNLAWGIYA